MKCRFPVQVLCKGRYIYVPCGKCAWCLARLRDQWSFRMEQESKNHMFTSFVTLTYDDDHLPINIDSDGVMVPSVRYADVRNFHKSLYEKADFRYLLASEYGPKTLRPHYHAIYWHDVPFRFVDHWKFGSNNVQKPANAGAFRYVLKYMLKGSKVPVGGDPNFRCMSKRPGIGSMFVYKGAPFVITEKGVKLAVPRYYLKNYEKSLNEKILAFIKTQRLMIMSEEDQHAKFHEIYEELLSQGFLDPSYSFESWLFDLYGKDFKKQVYLNLHSDG